jgi:hypothetical protein
MPHGFPVSHPRFWSNSALPGLLIVAVLVGRFAVRDGIRAALTVLAAIWVAAAISARFVFPVTFGSLFIAPLVIGLIIAGLCVSGVGLRSQFQPGMISLFWVFGALIGMSWPLTQRADWPDTRPINSELVAVDSKQTNAGFLDDWTLGTGVRFSAEFATVQLLSERCTLSILPMLTFQSRSPDGCWTLLAPRSERRRIHRSLIDLKTVDGGVLASYRSNDFSLLKITADNSGSHLRLEAQSRLTQPVWSHLNTFTELQFRADGKPSISFSPCPEKLIEVVDFDYPFGSPARFAYLDGSDVFRVVEARSAEKGPFRELASGPLPAGSPLVLTFHSNDVPSYRVTFQDWSAQAGRQLSPTAGWNVPVNAIEFVKDYDSAAHVFITLASTSIGRGYDSVGHAAGTYRNRMVVESLVPPGRK